MCVRTMIGVECCTSVVVVVAVRMFANYNNIDRRAKRAKTIQQCCMYSVPTREDMMFTSYERIEYNLADDAWLPKLKGCKESWLV